MKSFGLILDKLQKNEQKKSLSLHNRNQGYLVLEKVGVF